ncbi:MAG: ATP-dependent Clp protease ATP-binding subunit, partial [Clostridia bacterium]|nr:ATP-dependent Clp protease ATP-binding subunit [Clostridia bacterium]
ATTLEEYRRHIERDAALERRFQQVTVREPTPQESVAILRGLREKYEAHHKLKISDEAIGAAVDLSVRYVKDRYLPDKAIDLIDESASRMKIEAGRESGASCELDRMIRDAGIKKREALISSDLDAASKLSAAQASLIEEYRKMRSAETEESGDETLTLEAKDVARTLTAWTGVPVSAMSEDVQTELSGLGERLSSSVIGQNEAIDVVCRAVKRGRVGIKDPERPTAVFLFAGPTGVGKTELAKELARIVFKNPKGLIRFDMSEFSEESSVSKLVGSPPGYVGYNDAPRLTEAVRRTPYSVVLFDEIEKAHPDVRNILLQIMENGVLTDATGRECDFKNTIVIMTSNIGAGKGCGAVCLGFSANAENDLYETAARKAFDEDLKRTFSPEFIGRIDEVVLFKKLTFEEIEKIASKFLLQTASRLRGAKIDLSFDGAVATYIASCADFGKYGARNVRRLVSTLVDDALAERIISGKIKRGDSVSVSVLDDEVVFEARRGSSVGEREVQGSFNTP